MYATEDSTLITKNGVLNHTVAYAYENPAYSAGRCASIKPSIGWSAGNGHACRPARPTTALSPRLMTNRYSTQARCTGASPLIVGRYTRGRARLAALGFRHGFQRVLRAPR